MRHRQQFPIPAQRRIRARTKVIAGTAVVFAIGATGLKAADACKCIEPVAECNNPPAGYNVIDGTDSGETLNGTSGKDIIRGFGGNDTLNGYSSNDILCGGSGDDVLNGGSGNDTLSGGEGSDTLNQGSGTGAAYQDCGNYIE